MKRNEGGGEGAAAVVTGRPRDESGKADSLTPGLNARYAREITRTHASEAYTEKEGRG